MHYQRKNKGVMAKYRVYRMMIKTGTEPSLDFPSRKELLNDHQSRKGRKPLILATKRWNAMDTGENLRFTIFHYQWPPALFDFASCNVNYNQPGGRFARV